jgi:hypothetical protein
MCLCSPTQNNDDEDLRDAEKILKQASEKSLKEISRLE